MTTGLVHPTLDSSMITSSTITSANSDLVELFNIKQLRVHAGQKRLLNISDLALYQQRLTTFIGPNGAGKSTLLQTLLNRNSHNGLKISGEIVTHLPNGANTEHLANSLSDKSSPNSKTVSTNISAGSIAWVGQHERFELPLNVLEYALLGVSPQLRWYQNANSHQVLEAQSLLHSFELSHLQHRRVQTLSGGEQQRLAVVRALMQQTQVLMLDEPTNHLDIRHQRFLLRYLRQLVLEQQKTILVVLHDLSHAYRYSDEVLLMNEGQVVAQGSPQQVMTQEQLSAIYHTDIETYDTQSGRLFVS
ncbi:MAG TPA: ABC transporter ATP-binding protein [Psychrobacter sp.]|nr:ABC transporter ATP-binding protein [Psychrobacter sp.]